MTVSAPPAFPRLGEAAQMAGAQDILERLAAVSLQTDTRPFVGVLVSYLAQRERLGILSDWASENATAANLTTLGRAAWADTELLRQLRPIGDEHPAKQLFRGYLASHYLVAMAATRRAYSLNPLSQGFVERLRLLLLIKAIEAAERAVFRELNLAEACAVVRQVSDRTESDKWPWIDRIAHSALGFDDFVSETRFQVQKAGAAARSGQPERSFYTSLHQVLDGRLREGQGNAPAPLAGPLGRYQSSGALRTDLLLPPATDAASDENTAGQQLHVVAGADETRGFVCGDVDTSKSAPAQRAQGKGVVLQALEDSQYLRHSWHRLNLLEEKEFLKRAQELMQSGHDDVDRVGAALTVVGMLTSKPLSSLKSMPVQSRLTDDWSFDPRAGALRRRPPRFPRRWSAREEKAVEWIQPLAKEWRVNLSGLVRSALSTVTGKSLRTGSIGELWSRVSPKEPLHLWFGRCFADTEPLERLTSPVVAALIGQRAFEHADDHALARLVSSSTRSGLPAACTYGAYSGLDVRTAVSQTLAPEFGALAEPAATSEDNAAGSELDVDPSRMAVVIRGMIKRLDGTARHAESWVEHHNQLTALCVIALLASTGARPVNSPFESLDWIDLDRKLIYVEDKHSGPTQGARLCVLSDFSCDLLSNHYLPHLASLSRALRGIASAMADEIDKILARDSECRLPLFFLLRAKPTLDWIEVSESLLTATLDSPWPLPWNIFRHLQSTQLRRWGLHPEIRDALLSHGDRGAESHGEFSWRIPRDDLEVARPLVNRLAQELGFRLPAKRATEPVINGLPTATPDFAVSKAFGRKARARRREATHQAACRTARADIKHRIGDRPASSLTAKEWDGIAKTMLLREDGLAHPMASLRYDVFEDYLAELWHGSAARLKLPARRYMPIREGASIFTEDVIHAQRHLEDFRGRFDAALGDEAIRTPRRPALAACLAALELVLHCRVGHFPVLAGVACNSGSVRLVRFNARYWLEWAYRGDWKDGRPNYRVPITDRAAGWIGAAQGAKKRLTEVPDTPQALHSLVGSRDVDFGMRLKALASLVAQANKLFLPGAMAAALNGERETAALPHSDWIRAVHLAAPKVAEAVADVDPASSNTEDHFFRHHSRATSVADHDALQRCRTLFDAIQRILATDKQAVVDEACANDRQVVMTPQRRATAIDRAVQASGFGQGDAPFVMAHYAAHLLKRPKQSGTAGTLKASTALRYWESLKPGFLDFAFDLYLPDLEEDELTALYEQVVNAAGALNDGQEQPLSPGHAKRRRLKGDSDAGQRALNELVGFHEFARELYGLDDPDWSEIAPGRVVGHGRPGIVLLDEYRTALSRLMSSHKVHALEDDTLAAAFVLFTCARFGLRGGEAAGLERRDWVQISGSIVVLVQSNHIRSLKNVRSKRQVPLIGRLSEIELALIDEVLRRWEHREGVKRNSPLIPGVSAKGFKMQQRWISTQLLPLIKSVTRSPASTIHHLRHGFACHLLTLVCGKSVGVGLHSTEGEAMDARKLLMTTTDAGRRTLWSVARMLGHTSPATTLKAYTHVIDAWLPELPTRLSAVEPARARHLVNLDQAERDVSYLASPSAVPMTPIETESMWVRSLRYLRLRALGNADAAALSRLTADQVALINDTLQQAVSWISVMPKATRTSRELLAGVRPARWKILIDLAMHSPDQVELQPSDEWPCTVGANRQIVLFSSESFRWAGQFVKNLGLTAADCKIVHDLRVHPQLMRDLEASGLATFAVTKAEYAKSFQLDKAVFGSPKRTFEDRMAIVPTRTGRLADTIELTILWLTWLCASSGIPR